MVLLQQMDRCPELGGKFCETAVSDPASTEDFVGTAEFAPCGT